VRNQPEGDFKDMYKAAKTLYKLLRHFLTEKYLHSMVFREFPMYGHIKPFLYYFNPWLYFYMIQLLS